MITHISLICFCILVTLGSVYATEDTPSIITSPSNIDVNTNNIASLVTLSSGYPSGVYYAVGNSICRLFNLNIQKNKTKCILLSSEGSISNIVSLSLGNTDLAIAQADWVHHSYNGTSIFQSSTPNQSIRALFSLYNENLIIVVKKDSGINNINDLIGKRVNIGPAGSGIRATMEEIMAIKSWDIKKFSNASEYPISEQVQRLCSSKIDAAIFITGNPNQMIDDAIRYCNAKIINIDDADIDKLIKQKPFYVSSQIKLNTYIDQAYNIKTIGVKSILITKETMDNDTAYAITTAVFDNLDAMKDANPSMSDSNIKNMTTEGITIPMHIGSVKYFKEHNSF